MRYTLAMTRPPLGRTIIVPSTSDASATLLLNRLGVTRPYFALEDIAVEGERFEATAGAEMPAFFEQGPMAAAEIGRHAAIAGQCSVALAQRDDRQRFFLANAAECNYVANDAPYGAPLRFVATLASLEKRRAVVRVRVTAKGKPAAEIEVRYTILPQVTFERLFRTRQMPTPPAANPYGTLLSETFDRDSDWAEQLLTIPVGHCVGHFDNYPALPVALVMGQLSYLAGQLMGTPYRVTRGSVHAKDLCWAGEKIRFSAHRLGSEGNLHRFVCAAKTAEKREVGNMDLWLERLPVGAVAN